MNSPSSLRTNSSVRRTPRTRGVPACTTVGDTSSPSPHDRPALLYVPARGCRDRHRRRHHRRPLVRRRRGRSAGRLRLPGSSRSTSRGPGWVEHDAERDLGRRAGDARRAGGPGRRAGATPSRPSASPTSARRWSPGTAAPAGPGTGPSCGRTGAPPPAATSWRDGRLRDRAGHDRAGARPLLLRRPRSSGCSAQGGVDADDDLAVGTIDCLAPLEPHRRRRARHRAVERQPHDALRHLDHAMVATSCAICSVCPVAALPEVRPSSGRFGVTAAGLPIRRRHPHQRHRRRPAGRPVRAGLLRPRA